MRVTNRHVLLHSVRLTHGSVLLGTRASLTMPYRYTSVVNAGVRAAAQVERHYRHQLALAIQRECRFSAARRSAIFGFVFGKMHEVLQMLRRVPSSYSGRENCRYFGEYPPRPSAGKACATGTGSHGSKALSRAVYRHRARSVDGFLCPPIDSPLSPHNRSELSPVRYVAS